jgi:hypothetical protein
MMTKPFELNIAVSDRAFRRRIAPAATLHQYLHAPMGFPGFPRPDRDISSSSGS